LNNPTNSFEKNEKNFFSDFYDDTNVTQQWWIEEFERYHSEVSLSISILTNLPIFQLAFDGIWIDMNEPSVFGTNSDHPWYYDNPDHPDDKPLTCPVKGTDSTLDIPPYATWASYTFENKPLCDVTLCMLGVVNRGKQTIYDTKSMYGYKETIATIEALKQSTGKRGQVISRSTFHSSGKYGGHW
jgi:alpha-glucosidase (family GH31 glycosyl hydrolase)